MMANPAHATERPGVATRAPGDVGDDRRRGVRRLAAIRQVMRRGSLPGQTAPGVATRARGDLWPQHRRLAAIRQGLALL